MPDAIVRVFVSSTWLDLGPERAAVRDAVERLRETKFVGMEHFGSRDETTRRASLDEVSRSHVYVGLFAARYGSGITADEYRRARENNLPCLIYFKDDATIPADLRDTDPTQTAKLDALKQELRAAHLIAPPFTTPQDLAARVTADLHRWLFDHYLTPRLEAALRGELPRAEAQTLLDAVKDLSALSRDLLERLQGAGFVVNIAGDFVARDKVTNIYHAPAVAVSALHQLPPPPRDFTGRADELAELMSKLGQGGVTISGLQGLGGIGKTALALKLAEQLKARYPDAQFYLDLKGASQQPLSAGAALSHVIRAFHPTAKLPEDEAQLRALYLSVLDGQRALLLMDNAAGREQVEPLEPPAGCVLLVTSRRHFTLPGLFAKHLDALLPADARQLLLKIAPRIGEHADEIAQLCGYLPLALRMAGGALAERVNLSPSDYVRRLSDAQKRLELVEASLSLSYDLLSPDLQRLWRALAVFPGTFGTAAAAAVWETDGDAALDTLAELIRYSLVEWDATAARYHLHDLARLFADARLSGAERDGGRLRHATHYLGVVQEANHSYKQGGESIKRGLALFDLEWRNIQAGQLWAEELSEEIDAAASLCCSYPSVGWNTFTLRQQPREGIDRVTAALNAARRLKQRSLEAGHLGALGLLQADLGELRAAITSHEQALQIYRELGDRYTEGATLGNLGTAYIKLGEPRRAIDFLQQRLDIAREAGDRRGEGNALGNLGNAYAVLGEQQRAIEFYEQQLIIAREIGDWRGEANSHFNTGLALDELGDPAQALAHAEAALEIFEQIGSPHVALVRAKIAEWRGQG